MKTQLSSFAISVMILSSATFSSPAKLSEPGKAEKVEQVTNAGFSFFRTHRQGKGVTATWGLTSSTGVVRFSVQKTYEDPYDPYAEWFEVATGECNGSRSYKCTDANVSPGSITYRVVATLDDGSTVESAISTVRIVSH
jgi:hypothetical protein